MIAMGNKRVGETICTNLQARQHADSTQADVSWAAGQAAAAWAEVETMESKGDAAGAAASAAEAVALQQQAQQRQAAASAAAAQAQQKVMSLPVAGLPLAKPAHNSRLLSSFLSWCTPSRVGPYSPAKAKHDYSGSHHHFAWCI